MHAFHFMPQMLDGGMRAGVESLGPKPGCPLSGVNIDALQLHMRASQIVRYALSGR